MNFKIAKRESQTLLRVLHLRGLRITDLEAGLKDEYESYVRVEVETITYYYHTRRNRSLAWLKHWTRKFVPKSSHY